MFNSSLYTAFVGAQSGVNTTYTLPTTSPATGSSVLQSTSTGVMSWVPMTAGGGGGSPSGSIGDIQYNSGTGNFAASSTLNYANATGMLKTINYNAGSASNYALLVGENNAVNFSGSATGTLLALSNTSSNGAQYNFIDAQFFNGSAPSNLTVFKVDYLGRSRVADLTITSAAYATRTNNNTLTTSASQAADLTYTLPLAYPAGAGTSFLSASTTGVMAWVAAPSGGSSGAGSGTVAIPNAQFGVAYYAGTGASVSGTSLMQVLTSGTAISVFTNFDLRDQNDIRFFNADNSRFAALQASNVATNYTLSLPTAPVGNGYSTILVDTSGNMYFAPLEGGLAVTSATGNRVVLRNKMEHHVWMAAGYTPLAAGPDNVIYLVPDSSEDGASKITFQLKEFMIRAETPSAGTSRIQLEKSSTDTGAFTLAATGSSLIGGSGLTLSGAGIYVTTTNTFVAGTFVTSGNLLRLNFNLLNATHANFSVQFTLNEV